MEIAALELFHVVSELRRFVGARFDSFYELYPNAFLLRLRQPKVFIVCLLPLTLHMTERAYETPPTPTSFAMSIRKHLGTSMLNDVQMHEWDRIVLFEFDTGLLIVELFSRGNIIFADKDHIIQAVYRRETWKDRTLVPKERYRFPPRRSLREHPTTIHYLAHVKNLGTRYLERICAGAHIDPNTPWEQLSVDTQNLLLSRLEEMVKSPPHPMVFSQGFSLFPTEKEAETGTPFSSPSAMLDAFFAPLIRQNSQISTSSERTRILSAQHEARERFLKEAETYKKMGDAIFLHYSYLRHLVETIRERLARGESRERIERECKVKLSGPILEVELDDTPPP